jgi:hypothetical protein
MSSGYLLVTLDKSAERSCSSFALVVFLCAGEELLPLSGKCYQWEVQTDEGWTPYWDPQA